MSRRDGAVRPGNGLTRRGLLRRGLGAIAGMGLLEISPSTTGRAATAAPPARGRTLVFATGAEALNLDPPYAGDGPSNIPTSMIYNNLVKFAIGWLQYYVQRCLRANRYFQCFKANGAEYQHICFNYIVEGKISVYICCCAGSLSLYGN